MGKLIKKFFVQFFPWPLGGARPHLPLMTSRHCTRAVARPDSNLTVHFSLTCVFPSVSPFTAISLSL